MTWTHAPGDEGPDIFLTAANRSYKLAFSEGLLKSYGGALGLYRRYMEVEGHFTRDGKAIQVEKIAALPKDQMPPSMIAGMKSQFGEQLGAIAGHGPALLNGKLDDEPPTIRPAFNGSKPFITILAKFSDIPGVTPHPASWYQDMMTSPHPSMNHYYVEQSYGNINLTGSTVHDWITLPKTQAQYHTGDAIGVDYAAVITDAVNAIAATTDFSGFYGINVIVNSQVGNIGGVGGLRTFTLNGSTRLWGATYDNSGSGMFPLLAHEMGHTFGFDHSSGPYNTPYDSDYDQMSDGSNPAVVDPTFGPLPVHTNSYHRMKVGWIAATKISNVFPGDDVTIRLEQTVRPTVNGFLMGRIFLGGDANHYLTLETRKYSGIYEKSGVLPGEGVVLHDVQELRTQASDINPANDRRSEVVDQSNNGDTNDAGSRLIIGQTYTDAANGVTISVTGGDATSFTVHITQNSSQALPNTVTNTADVGPKSLRSAITFANIFPGTTVRFNVPPADPNFSGGVAKFSPLSPLPVLVSKNTIIDGTTQTSSRGDTNTKGPEISLNGTSAGASSDALVLQAATQSIKSVQIGNFGGYGVRFDTGSIAGVLLKCYIGVDPTGATAASNAFGGVLLQNTVSSTTIGGSGTGNVISGNGQAGIAIVGNKVSQVTIQGNTIGLGADGVTKISNPNGGINAYLGPTGVKIGSTAVTTRNIISGNGGSGIYFSAVTKSSIYGNYIGTDKTGTLARPNTFGGVEVIDGSSVVSIGSKTAGAGNLISGNTQNGIYISGSNSITIQGNICGTDPTGGTALPNTSDGIAVANASTNVTIGGLGLGMNLISGNSFNGISFWNNGTMGNFVYGNRVGTNAAGGVAIPNGATGIAINAGVSKITVGGTAAGLGNLVSGNLGNGIGLWGASACTLAGNRAGTDAGGTTAIPNAFDGISLAQGSASNIVGGSAAGAGNLLSGNTGSGLAMYDAGTNSNVVRGNIMGLNVSGGGLLANVHNGITLSAGPSNNTIGGTTASVRNFLSGNGGYGIGIYQSGSNSNTVAGNYIGTTMNGAGPAPNAFAGVYVGPNNQNNVIGGGTGAGNLIAGNATDGVDLQGPGNSKTVVQGNTFGLTSGGGSLPNGWGGVVLYQGATQCLVQGNLVCGFSGVGVAITDAASTGNQVYGNRIGVNSGGSASNTGWSGVGMWAGTTLNLIGGFNPGQSNFISSSTRGIYVSDAATVGNTLRNNMIPAQSGSVIDLQSNGNHLQAAPTITSIAISGSQRIVNISLTSTANRTFWIDLYGCTATVGGVGLPSSYLGTAQLTTSAAGTGSTTFTLTTTPFPANVCVTATDQTTFDTGKMSLAVPTP